ncbi:hypothetical protein [Microbacterium sp. 179-I 3D3 NHS]|uniref:hypothetical protein n=1 Tax=Microbacterium sp. 179-I 3D3 NHS TaxID=3142382 RepID=UPI00399FA871
MITTSEDAADLVDRYLQFCEDRDLASASALWAPGIPRIEFPGPVVYSSLDELVAASRAQYAWVRKRRDEYAVATDADGAWTVTSIGRLYGVGLDGADFADVRYVDVFTVGGDGIRAQRVWNDLVIAGIVPPVR